MTKSQNFLSGSVGNPLSVKLVIYYVLRPSVSGFRKGINTLSMLTLNG